MADNWCATPAPQLEPRRVASIIIHPPRMSVQPDADGFMEVQSRRRWRHAPEPRRPVPPNLVGKCFNCLAEDHVRADYTFPSKCFNCKGEGHQERDCPFPPLSSRWEGKRDRSPGRAPWQ
jgi:hypothetical protein